VRGMTAVRTTHRMTLAPSPLEECQDSVQRYQDFVKIWTSRVACDPYATGCA
jgi:hypothetical protein